MGVGKLLTYFLDVIVNRTWGYKAGCLDLLSHDIKQNIDSVLSVARHNLSRYSTRHPDSSQSDPELTPTATKVPRVPTPAPLRTPTWFCEGREAYWPPTPTPMPSSPESPKTRCQRKCALFGRCYRDHLALTESPPTTTHLKSTRDVRDEARRAFQGRLDASHRANKALEHSLAHSDARAQSYRVVYEAALNHNTCLEGRLRCAKAEIRELQDELHAMRDAVGLEGMPPGRLAARQLAVIDLTVSEDESLPDATTLAVGKSIASLGVGGRVLLRSPIAGTDLSRRLRIHPTDTRAAYSVNVERPKKDIWSAKVIVWQSHTHRTRPPAL
ncbi:hypothetical protein BDV93DRAFT_504535 [Ceratobasidium sp. AG-I]|nr:hypothetical protein BDV93DRAFT_504535 [Ceratobasidium sp. AG-I]